MKAQKDIDTCSTHEASKRHELKCMLLGTQGAGKTSLLEYILNQDIDSKQAKAGGVVFYSKSYRKDKESAKVHLWEFCGDKDMHALHQIFFSKRGLYILVLNARKDEEPNYWLELLKLFGGNSPVLVVANRMDENSAYKINERELQNKYDFIQGFFYVSCTANRGIQGEKRLLSKIRETVFSAEIFRVTPNKSWVEVKIKLEAMKKEGLPFFDSHKYQIICESAGITNEEESNLLADYLNDIGTIVHFKEHDISDMHILEPHWITNAIYRIITSKKTKDNKGVLTRNEIRAILNKSINGFSYPSGKHHYILKLMELFELCFWMDIDRILIPSMQQDIEPELPAFSKDEPLRFDYSYPFLPVSLFPQFTVRMSRDIMEGFHWKTGIVLEDDNFKTTSVIKCDENVKRINVSVYGSQKKDSLSYIRKTFHDIHCDYGINGVKKFIPLPDTDNEEASFENISGHWKAGEKLYLHGQTGIYYSVQKLIEGYETKNDQIKRILKNADLSLEDIKGKTPQAISNIIIQNINGEHAKGLQAGKMGDYNELFKNVNFDELI